MRVLLSGATGYLGVHLASAAHRMGQQVHALIRSASEVSRLKEAAPAVKLHCIDERFSTIAAAIAAAEPDVIYHLASDTRAMVQGGDIANLIAANVTLGTHLCQALAERGHGRLVNAGTYWEYGATGSYAPNSLYAATKRALENIAVHYAENCGLGIRTLVIYDVYGCGDWRGKLLPTLARALVEGKPMALTAGEQLLDLVHVTDVARGFLAAGDSLMSERQSSHQTYSLSSGSQQTLRSLVEQLCRCLDRPDIVGWGRVPYPSHQIYNPVTTIPRLPGWQPLISLAQGLGELAAEAQRPSSPDE